MTGRNKYALLTWFPETAVLPRLPWIIAMQMLIAVVLCYPLYVGGLPQVADPAGPPDWLALARQDLRAYLSFQFSPVILKGVLAATCALAFLASVFAGQMVAPRSVSATRHPWRKFRYFSWLALVAWLAASAAWSPTRLISVEAAAWSGLFGLFGFTLLRREFAAERLSQLAVLLVGLGAIVGAVSVLQATEAFGGAIDRVFYRFDNPRNAFGSVLGHNSAVASFMLLTLFPAVALAIGQRRVALRALLLAYCTLALFVIVITQSRAIWMLTPLLLLGFFVGPARRGLGSFAKRNLLASLTAIALFLTASQAVRAPWNPLFLQRTDVADRLADLSLESLRGEARLRLLVCSLPFIGQKPLFGSGLHSFQYVYPEAQADYFAAHPDSTLNRTTLRSHMAHNEYLQLAVEAGAVGLGLGLLVLLEIAYRGKRTRKNLISSSKLLHAAFGFSALAVAIHALVDFPFHLPQLAVPWLLCVGAFAGATNQQDNMISLETRKGTAEPPQGDPRLPSPLFLAMAGIAIFSTPMLAFFFARFLPSDYEFTRASGELAGFEITSDPASRAGQQARLGRAIDRLHHSIRIQPSNEQARYLLAEAYYDRAGLRLAPISRSDTIDISNRADAAADLNRAIETLERNMRGLRNHHSFYLAALCHRALLQTGLPASEPVDAMPFQTNLEKAIYFAPTYAPALHMLAVWLARAPGPDTQRILRYQRTIYRFDPPFFDHRYLEPAMAAIESRLHTSAARAAEQLFRIQESDPRFLKLALEANMLAGTLQHRARASEIIEQLRISPHPTESLRPHPYHDSNARLYAAILAKDWTALAQELGRHRTDDPRRRARLHALESFAGSQAGLPPEATRFPRPHSVSPELWQATLLEEGAFVHFRLLGDVETAGEYFEKRARIDPPPGTNYWIDTADWAISADRPELRRRAIGRIVSIDPHHPWLAKNRD